MKVKIKCGDSDRLRKEIEDFFLKNILEFLLCQIAIEIANTNIFIYDNLTYRKGRRIHETVEICVQLSEDAISAALNKDVPLEILKEKSGKFFNEARAIRKIEELNPGFSREYYNYNYKIGTGY